MRSCYVSLLLCVLILAPDAAEAQSASARIYVRRIEFQGAEGIDDEVLRRELLQLEGAYLNTVALEQSRLQLEQLPYIEGARAVLQPIDGISDQVDVLITVTRAPPRRYGGGGAYSEAQRASVHGYFTNENIFGTGQRFSAAANVSEFRTVAELSHTDPFTRSARVSRTLSLTSRQVDQLTADTAEMEVDLTSARLAYSWRTGERQATSLGLALNDVALTTGSLASEQFLDWVQRNGNPSTDDTAFSTEFWSADFLLRWRQDTRNRRVFPDRGIEQSLTFRAAIPSSEAEFYTIDYELTKYWPLMGQWTARLDAKLGYGAAYGSATSSLPPYLNWFAGGPDSVRGYRESQLGPQDSLGKPYGGNLFVSGQFELMMPLPEKWRERLRIGVFYDVGNVFSTEDVAFLDGTGERLDHGFEFSRMRQSAGVSARVLIPIGVVRLSYGIPLNADDDHPNPFLRDDTERFQIAIGVDF